MRVHELAKELGTTSKDLLLKLKERHIEAKNHMASLDEDVVKLFLEEKAAVRGQASVKVFVKEKKAAEKKDAHAAVKKPEAYHPALEPAAAGKKEEALAAYGPAFEEQQAAPVKVLKPLEVSVPITIKDLAVKLQIKPGDLIKYLIIKFKLFANINQSLSEDIVEEMLKEYGYEFVRPPSLEEAAIGTYEKIPENLLKPRSPIVTFMGHVDHGKTSLLDAIRRTKVVDSEHGGITQHIGAYEVKLPKGSITFLDTPGHEAFTAMRARGATVTDIVVLVVAADDGVMPQTIEALDHAKAAGVPIIVAMNKIDKPQVDIDKLKRQLNELGLVPEDWGGKTITVGVSAKTGAGIDTLMEMILLEAEILELKGVYDREATGVVIEAKLSKGRGPVATILVQSGTLKVGDFVIAGYQSGRIRAMTNDLRQSVQQAGPSEPVEITGLSGVPEAGEKFYVVTDEKKARQIIEKKQEEFRRQRLEPGSKRTHLHLEDLYRQIKEGRVRELNIILKADVQGSIEAIEDSLQKIGTSEVKITVMHKAAGLINTSDVVLAAASNAIIIGFHVEPDDMSRQMAQKEGIDIRTYRVIYEIVNDMKAALEGMLAPRIKKTFVGRAEVRKVFELSKSGVVAGSIVRKGKILRSSTVVLVRNGQPVFEGKIAALKRFKDDVRDVQEGFECGISLAGFDDIKEGDFIDAFELESIARKL
ncbi:MAG TPA: translation initiation factor IF-2 [Candidatus Omnitrophica bacterium]|nr:translation initiation factor IF-2 [Candidatus Omnitrophota bacterium]